MVIKIILIALMDAFFGWLAFYALIKMIFLPLEPIKIPLTRFKVQGLIPKKRLEIAGAIGTIVEKNVSLEDLLSEVINDDNKKEILFSIKSKIMEVLEDRMPALVPRFLRHLILNKVAQVLNMELNTFLDNAVIDLTDTVISKFDLTGIIEGKLNELDLKEIKDFVFSSGKRQLRYLRLLGAALGFIMGIVQGILLKLLGFL